MKSDQLIERMKRRAEIAARLGEFLEDNNTQDVPHHRWPRQGTGLRPRAERALAAVPGMRGWEVFSPGKGKHR